MTNNNKIIMSRILRGWEPHSSGLPPPTNLPAFTVTPAKQRGHFRTLGLSGQTTPSLAMAPRPASPLVRLAPTTRNVVAPSVNPPADSVVLPGGKPVPKMPTVVARYANLMACATSTLIRPSPWHSWSKLKHFRTQSMRNPLFPLLPLAHILWLKDLLHAIEFNQICNPTILEKELSWTRTTIWADPSWFNSKIASSFTTITHKDLVRMASRPMASSVTSLWTRGMSETMLAIYNRPRGPFRTVLVWTWLPTERIYSFLSKTLAQKARHGTPIRRGGSL